MLPLLACYQITLIASLLQQSVLLAAQIACCIGANHTICDDGPTKITMPQCVLEDCIVPLTHQHFVCNFYCMGCSVTQRPISTCTNCMAGVSSQTSAWLLCRVSLQWPKVHFQQVRRRSAQIGLLQDWLGELAPSMYCTLTPRIAVQVSPALWLVPSSTANTGGTTPCMTRHICSPHAPDASAGHLISLMETLGLNVCTG